MQFIFTDVDVNDPKREFTFTLHTAESGKAQYSGAHALTPGRCQGGCIMTAWLWFHALCVSCWGT